MIGVSEITRMIPHRHPILLVDRVLDVVPGERLTALKAVTCTEPCYQHTGQHIAGAAGAVGAAGAAGTADYAYPVPLLIESLAQAAVLLAVWEAPNPDVLAGKIELAGVIKDVRVVRDVYPGDLLEHRVRLVRSVGDTAILAGSTSVGDTTVLEVGHFVLALRPVDALRPASPQTIPA